MRKRLMPGLLLSMLIAGLVFGSSFHLVLMPFFSGQLLHCLVIGILFGIMNYIIAHNFFQKYILLKAENNYLKDDIRVDKLTGVLNRKAFETDIKKTPSNELYSVIFLDIDNFREFNNRYGHQIGDQVLCKVCTEIKSCIRSGDHLYRYGGEELVVILHDCKKSNAMFIGEKIRHNISYLDNSPYSNITVSVGIASIQEDGNNIKEIVKASDHALLSAKKQGKNCVVSFSESDSF